MYLADREKLEGILKDAIEKANSDNGHRTRLGSLVFELYDRGTINMSDRTLCIIAILLDKIYEQQISLSIQESAINVLSSKTKG